jgi:hypothetical protein
MGRRSGTPSSWEVPLNSSSSETDPPAGQPVVITPTASAQERATYRIIRRHLAKFRDGALALFDLFDRHLAEPAAPVTPAPEGQAAAAEPAPAAPALQEKTPLELRIERHMSRVDQALIQIRDLNPERKKRAELPPEIRQVIETKQRTIYDIVGAELHFWAAAIENAPLDKFDEIERSWISRIIRLADLIGVDSEHKEHLAFLKDWASQEHS